MPSFGLAVVPLSAAIDERFGLPAGLFVREVTQGGGARAAGLQEGDVLTSVDGRASTDESALIRSALAHHVGDQVAVTYYRDGKTFDTTITLT
jgi:S1-C subfamily serine protease